MHVDPDLYLSWRLSRRRLNVSGGRGVQWRGLRGVKLEEEKEKEKAKGKTFGFGLGIRKLELYRISIYRFRLNCNHYTSKRPQSLC